MLTKIVGRLKKYAIIGSLFLSTAFPGTALANDITIGCRGPTNFQVDGRITYSEKGEEIDREETTTKTTNELLMLKYWNGDNIGTWAFVKLPYKTVSNNEGFSYGTNDISVGLGPRGKIPIGDGSFNFLSYGALTFPTGQLGNQRLDASIGLNYTFLSPKNTFDIDGTLNYTFTGESVNENGKIYNPPNVFSYGLVAGGQPFDGIRLAGGFTGKTTRKDEEGNTDTSINGRGVVRFIFSSQFHMEVIGDVGENYHAVTVLGRINL